MLGLPLSGVLGVLLFRGLGTLDGAYGQLQLRSVQQFPAFPPVLKELCGAGDQTQLVHYFWELLSSSLCQFSLLFWGPHAAFLWVYSW